MLMLPPWRWIRIPPRPQPRNLQQLGSWSFSHPRWDRPDHPLSCLNRDRRRSRLRMQRSHRIICCIRNHWKALLGCRSNPSKRIRRIQRSWKLRRIRQWCIPQASCLRREQRQRNLIRCPQRMRQRLPHSLHLRCIRSFILTLSLHCIIYVNAENNYTCFT